MPETRLPGLSSPARKIALVTPNDGADLPNAAKAIEVQGPGDIHLITEGGTEITKPFTAGYHPLYVQKIFAAGTTATGIYALYD